MDEAQYSLRLNVEANKVVVIVYANDWNITVTDTKNIPLLHNILCTHEQSTVAKINKSKAKDLIWGSGTRPLMY